MKITLLAHVNKTNNILLKQEHDVFVWLMCYWINKIIFNLKNNTIETTSFFLV